jgi:hypothetical protein
MKPDITAPGTATRSSNNTADSAYASGEGTSRASPHVAGAVALLWSARPWLQNNISSSRALLNSAAFHILDGICDGGPPVTPNNTYGNGRLDIFAAVEQDLLRRHGRAQHRSLARLLGCDGRRTWLISGCELRDNVHDCDPFSLQCGGDNRQSSQYVSSCKIDHLTNR